MKVRRLAAAVAVAASALVVVGSARAAAWKQVTATGGGNIDQVALLRTPDGTLHVAWHERSGSNTEDLMHTAITASGQVLGATPIQTGWAELQNAALVPGPGGEERFNIKKGAEPDLWMRLYRLEL